MIGYLAGYLYMAVLVLIPAMVLTYAITWVWERRVSRRTGQHARIAPWYAMFLGTILTFAVSVLLLEAVGLWVRPDSIEASLSVLGMVAASAFLALVFAPVVIVLVLTVERLRVAGWR